MAYKQKSGYRPLRLFTHKPWLKPAGVVFLLSFVLVGGYWTYRFTSANHSIYANIYANNVEYDLTVYTNSTLIIHWETLTNTGGYGCFTSGTTWEYGRKLSDGYYPASGDEDRSADTATTGTKSYTMYCVMDTGNQYATVNVNVVSPPPPPNTPPTAPGNLRTTATTTTSISLAWNASTDDKGIQYYRVYRNGTLLTTTGQLSYTNSGLSPSTSYNYQITAVDTDNAVSAGSNVLTAKTQAAQSPAPTTPPSTTTPPSNPTPPGSSPTPSPSSGTTSKPKTSSTSAPAPPPPSFTIAPSTMPSNGLDFLNITIADQTYTSAKIGWNTNLPATAAVEYANDASYTNGLKRDVADAKTDQSVTLESLAPGKTYYFRITATSSGKNTVREGQFDTRGFPVVVVLIDVKQQPVSGAEVTINAQKQLTDSDGQAYFELPAGSAVAGVKSAKGTQDFELTVAEKPFVDAQTAPESQSFTFVLSGGKKGLNAVKISVLLGGVALLSGGVWFVKRRLGNSEMLLTGMAASSTGKRRGRRKKENLDIDLSLATLPPPTPIQPNQLPTPPHPSLNDHHIPDWQQALRHDLKHTANPPEEAPKDMFETAEEQYHYNEKLKKPPHKPN